MTLPFTENQFLDVFLQYNNSLWPAVLVLWIATSGIILYWIYSKRNLNRILVSLLIIHWSWAGVLYHFIYFTRINPAAYLFSALFIIQALLFYRTGIGNDRLRFQLTFRGWNLIGLAMVIYSLVYPCLGLLAGFQYPRLATFGVPCPTILLSSGLLLMAGTSVPRSVYIIPIIWTIIGGSAAFLFGVYPDWMLIAAAVLLILHITTKGRLPAY